MNASMTQETKGMWLGAVGVAMFSLTLPFTRMAVAELNPVFIALGRAVIAAAMGYAEGGRLSQTMGGQQVISWALVLSVPLLLPITVWLGWHYGVDASARAWIGFGYVSLFSMFIGFFFWYKGLALGGIARVGQVQLLQPFLTLIGAVLLLGESLQASYILFALAIIAVVAIGRRMSIKR